MNESENDYGNPQTPWGLSLIDSIKYGPEEDIDTAKKDLRDRSESYKEVHKKRIALENKRLEIENQKLHLNQRQVK